MTGKRQHYVPRFLQRGFLIERDDSGTEGERTWLHRLCARARPVGIGDVGVEDLFYSRKGLPGEVTLDDAITEFERDFSRDVAILRGSAPRTSVEPEHAARTVVHLVMRTAHLRRTISSGMVSMMEEIEALFTDPQRFATMLGFATPALASVVTEAIRDTALKLVPAGFPPAFSERFLTFIIRERGDELAASAATMLSPLLATVLNGLADMVRDSHNELVAKPLDDHGWVGVLSGFTWSMEGASDLILPDAVALSRSADGPLEPLLFTCGRDAEVVLLPLAHDRMLVGRRDPAITVDLSTFNAAAAAACQGFFISARSHDEDKLSSAIGSGPAKALTNAIAESIARAEEVRSLALDQLPPAQPCEFEQEQFSYSVTLHDFGDDLLARAYADILQSVIKALTRDMPLHDLDGITIAADYADALATLDRGDPNLPPMVSGALAYGTGAAMPVTVKRNGKRKEHLVLAAWIAAGWTSENPEDRAMTLHLLIKMLAGIANSARFATPASFKPDEMAREFHLAVARAPSGYWSAKQAAFVAPDEGITYADLVLDSLEHAREAVSAARINMTDSSDVGEGFNVALETVSAILSHAADWIGHRDGLAQDQPFVGDGLKARLAPYGLDHWLALFGRDLASSYTDAGALDLSVVTTLSRHVERLFWSIGVYCWPDNGSVRCIISDQTLVPVDLSVSVMSE
ncbi:DUF4238 domain-containing protein [Aquisediminimonas sediminicola]|uniref:DUF4238 domain-containing protein n=1 Tax=Alteraquisediminimonas sediminicola TaxID=2676787 RepID=UPI001C8EBBF4|nr:DUF4238 domain-containing protein [Aquisediminimonas sediminicola]